ncbi:MAG: TrkH family potassium uptake protein [Spirochaetes bacterium]|nr:TrkH family potassium uptake protein [Spirochaetota bacterium]
MNYRLILRFLAVVVLILSLFMLIPLIVALIYEEYHLLDDFLIPIIIAALTSLMVLFTVKTDISRMHNRDGFLLVVIVWLVASLYGSFPFFSSGEIPSFVDALFESASGFTTTGSSILADIEGKSRAILFWRSLTHWLGGMGIISLAVAVLPILGVSGLQLLRAEMPGPDVERLTPRITRTAVILWVIYILITAAETLLLMLGGMDLFDALTHSFGTLATGGYSTRNASIAAFNSAYIDVVITIFMLLSGINFTLYYQIVNRRFLSVFKNTELRAYLAIYAIATCVVVFSLQENTYASYGESLRYGSFQVATLMTSTGFATANFDAWPSLAKSILLIMLFIGGCVGSTSGGIKMLHVVALVKQSFNEIKYLIHPRGVFLFKLNGRVVNKSFIYSIISFVFLYITIVLISTVVVSSSGIDLISSMSASLACIGNIGPGFGAVGPSQNFGFLPAPIKIWLVIIMIVGRLEVYTFIIILTPYYWRSRAGS